MAASSSQTVQQSFNILGYSLLVLGVYSFHVEPAKRTKLYRILQMIYCSLFTLVHSIVILGLTFSCFALFFKFLLYHNVNMIAYYISLIIILKACLVQRVLFYWKSCDIINYINDWSSFEMEYKSSTGNKLNAVSFKKFLTIFFLSTLAIIYFTIIDLKGEAIIPNSSVTLFGISVFASVINLIRLYIELIWYMFSSALRNAAVQLADDYKNELCQERGLDRSNYEYLWIKLAKLQSRLTLTLSKIYGYQLATNFLQLLFHGFVFFDFIFRYMNYDVLVMVLEDSNQRSHFVIYMLGLYAKMAICFVYLWLGATTAGSAQKALVDDTKRKLLGILSDNVQSNTTLHEQAKRFLQKVTATKTHITFSGYGRIDRQFFCTILITWINYMIILVQFKVSFYEEDKDETLKGTTRNRRSIPNVDSNEFQNHFSFLDFENFKMNMSASLPWLHDWYPLLASLN